jgi:hypothetical protein
VFAFPAAAVLGGIGWLVSAAWIGQILHTLERASVEVVTSDPNTIWMMRTGVAVALGLAPVLALVVRAVVTRLSRRPATLGEWAATTGWLLLGSQVGLGGALFNAARVAIPHALDASTVAGSVRLDAADLALGNWALAGVGGAAVIAAAIGLVSAGLESSESSAPGS